MRTGSICSVGAYQICALRMLPPRRTASAPASGSAVVIGTGRTWKVSSGPSGVLTGTFSPTS